MLEKKKRKEKKIEFCYLYKIGKYRKRANFRKTRYNRNFGSRLICHVYKTTYIYITYIHIAFLSSVAARD